MWRGGFRLGLSVTGPFGCRCLTSFAMLRFHIPLIKPDLRVIIPRLSQGPDRSRKETGTRLDNNGEGNGDAISVRREPCKVLIFSGCNSHPATGSLQPVATGAAVEETKPPEPSRHMCRYRRCSEPTGRNSQVTLSRPRNVQCGRRPTLCLGKAAAAGYRETVGTGRPTSDQGPAGHRGIDGGMSVNGDRTQHGKPMR